MYQQYRPGQDGMPIVVKNLLIINALFFLGTFILGDKFGIDMYQIFGLHYFTSEYFYPHQIITHMFMHGGFWHIALNMFMIWMFGSLLERLWGPKRFLFLYISAGLGAAFLQLTINGIEIEHIKSLAEAYANMPSEVTFSALDWEKYLNTVSYQRILEAHQTDVINPNVTEDVKSLFSQLITEKENGVMVGASGAGNGVIVAFATLFPNTLLYLYFAIPIKAKYAVAGFILLDLFSGISNQPGDNIAHFAHLGGALVGFLMVKYWNRNNRRSLF